MATHDSGTSVISPPRGNWKISQRRDGNVYALAIIDRGRTFDIGGIEVNAEPGLFPITDLAVREFRFKMNPRSMSLEEPAAVSIVPTQDGGQFIEHQGQIYKGINITGTTGLRPNKSRGGVKAIRNPFATTPTDAETGLPLDEQTGFDDLIDLRNFFEFYYAKKRDPEVAHNVIMIWQNGRDGEFFIVEPQTFRVQRDASSPFTSSYEITLRTIERLDLSLFLSAEDPLTKKNSISSFIQEVNAASRQLGNALGYAQSNIDRVVNIALAVTTAVLGPANAVFDGLTGVINTSRRVFSIPRSTIGLTIQRANETADALDDLALSYKAYGSTDGYKATANIYRNIARALARVFVMDKLFTTQLAVSVSTKSKAYRDPIQGMPRTGGDPSNLVNEPSGRSAKEVTIHVGEDIRKLAKRLLGHASRWKVIALLNNLKPPYISPDGDGVSVLRPGDRILIPSTAAVADTPIAFEGKNTADSSSSLEQRLGRDILIAQNQAMDGINVFDFQKNARGDVARVEGVNNMIQAVRIKFETEQGELPAHPRFGIRFPLGVKAPAVNSFVAFQVNARSTLLSDRRVKDVSVLQSSIEGNTIRMKVVVQIKGSDSPLSLNFEVRR